MKRAFLVAIVALVLVPTLVSAQYMGPVPTEKAMKAFAMIGKQLAALENDIRPPLRGAEFDALSERIGQTLKVIEVSMPFFRQFEADGMRELADLLGQVRFTLMVDRNAVQAQKEFAQALKKFQATQNDHLTLE